MVNCHHYLYTDAVIGIEKYHITLVLVPNVEKMKDLLLSKTIFDNLYIIKYSVHKGGKWNMKNNSRISVNQFQTTWESGT